ncbi:unnamed protein product [marine sediment metagenome]|uniref:Uncharacterized protein n=1 Tax=marine sediment metagenome TaxID=412755 RepID=X0TPX9_9ZZZZ
MKKRTLAFGRRKFLKNGASWTMMVWALPFLKPDEKSGPSTDIPRKTLEKWDETVQKYGAEFGGTDVCSLSIPKKGGQKDVCI